MVMELSRSDSERMIESFVLRGDISALTTQERTTLYVQMCESLGLNPASQPLALLKLNGKEILYPTRGATDQLASIHRINREIIDGPKVIDIAGTKLVYAACKATHPNGRTETSVATVPLADPVNVFMKVETKAKRRATLSILGLGMLDESELETIAANKKQETPQISGVVADVVELRPAQTGDVDKIVAVLKTPLGFLDLLALTDEIMQLSTARRAPAVKAFEAFWVRKIQSAGDLGTLESLQRAWGKISPQLRAECGEGLAAAYAQQLAALQPQTEPGEQG